MGKTDKSKTKQGTDFEMEIFTLLKSLGFKVERDVLIAGRQIDLVAKYELPLNNVYCVIIECKDHQSKVNVTQIERFGVVKSAIERRMDVDSGFFISRSGFTKEAKAFAKELKIKPITYDEIVESLNEMRIKKEIIEKEAKKAPLVNIDEYLSTSIWNFENSDIYGHYIDLKCQSEDGKLWNSIERYINNWLKDEKANHLTILGDFGTGKTITCQKICYNLSKNYLQQRSTIIPIYIQLRDFSGRIDFRDMIESYITKRRIPFLRFSDFFRSLKEGKILMILDGFDEMVSNTDYDVTMHNLRELNKTVLPRSKVILTARTHFFKSRVVEKELLKVEGIENRLIGAITSIPNSKIIYLQPFTKNDIEKYLKSVFQDNWNIYLRQIQSIYNLMDLSHTPILLNIIVKTLPVIIKVGDTINTSILYEIYTNFWVDREDWRRQILSKNEKNAFMEELAYKMYVNQKMNIHYSELPEEITQRCNSIDITNPNDIEKIDNDIRTCSFLIRDDNGNYRFVHKSFMEYFVAKKVKNDIESNRYIDFSHTDEIYNFIKDMEINCPNCNELLSLDHDENISLAKPDYIHGYRDTFDFLRCHCNKRKYIIRIRSEH
jgi:predicted NACHT family NTPase